MSGRSGRVFGGVRRDRIHIGPARSDGARHGEWFARKPLHITTTPHPRTRYKDRQSVTHPLRGADILARSLAAAGTRKVFSLSGNHVMPIFDATIEANLDIVHVRHEGAATHMADAWGRLTGEPGVCLFTGGPGHANAVGPLVTALGAESPVVMLSGHAPLGQLGFDAFQELRQAEMAAPAAKASWTAQTAQGLGADIARAMRIARSGRPGPVHVSIPTDIMEVLVDDGARWIAQPDATRAPSAALAPDVAAAIVAQLRNARRPLVLTGPMMGNGNARRLREQLAQVSGVPVLYMESPRGVADPTLGAVAEILAQADLVLMLGKKLDFTVRFGQEPLFAANCRFIQVDPEPVALERARLASGDPARIVFATLADTIPAAQALIAAWSAGKPITGGWAAEVAAAQAFRPDEWKTISSREGAIHGLHVGQAVRGLIDRLTDPIYVSDGGECSQWSQACVGERAAMRMTNGPGGAIGGGVAFAIGAALAHPRSPVVLTIGDGSFGYHMAEYETAVRCKAPFVAIVGNDACWNAEHQIQLRVYGAERAIGCEMLATRYDQVVTALGGHGELVTRVAELPAALDRAIQSGKPACLNVMVQRVAAPTFSRRALQPTVSGT